MIYAIILNNNYGIENDCLAHSLYRFIFLLSIILCIDTVLLNEEKPCKFLKYAIKYTSLDGIVK